MLQLPTTKGGSLVLGGAAAERLLREARHDRRPAGPRRPLLGLRRPRHGRSRSSRASGSTCPRSAAAVLAAARVAPSRASRTSPSHRSTVGRTHRRRQGDGDHRRRRAATRRSTAASPNRIHNVELVAHLIDGKLIAPGATFSFNEATGDRTAAKGFLEAPVIINGELSTGLGGGVCQVSTTVFNAAYEAGLPITARTNHALYISHYPLGRDATVDYPDIDLKFVNDTDHWLLLRTFVGSSSLVVTLYGAPQHRRVVTEHGAAAQVVAPAPVQRKLDPSLAPGTSVVAGLRRACALDLGASAASTRRTASCSRTRPGTRTTARRRRSSSSARSRSPSRSRSRRRRHDRRRRRHGLGAPHRSQ